MTTVEGRAVEHGSLEETGGGATRTQHVVHVISRDSDDVAHLVSPPIERFAAEPGNVRVLVVVPRVEDAVALAAAVNTGKGRSAPMLVPLTSSRRGQRLLARQPVAVAGVPGDLVALIASSALKLAEVRAVVIMWAGELLAAGEEVRAALDALLPELPRDIERIAFTAQMSDAVEGFLERWMWRARRVSHAEAAPSAHVAMRYFVTAPANRTAALRLLLDALDPATACVMAFSDPGETAARSALASLGYAEDDATVTVQRTVPASDVELAVIYDEPGSVESLRDLADRATQIVALVAPSRVGRLCELAGAECTALQFTDAFQQARSAEDALRLELRAAITGGLISPQLLLLEPLFEEHDAARIAAAAVALLQKERQRARRVSESARAPAAAPMAAPARQRAAAAAPAMTRIFLGVGERDGVRRGDLVGAITGEAGIVGTQIGRIDLHEAHAIVEVSSDVAAQVIERMNGSAIRGRRVVAREDRDRGEAAGGMERRPRGPRERGDRPPVRRGERGERPAPRRHGESGPRGRGPGGREGGRAGRGGGGRGDESRGPRRDRRDDTDFDRTPRAARESEEWAERAERLRNARGGAPEEA